jgi:hypothetical protein
MFRHTAPYNLRPLFGFLVYILLGILLFCGGNILARAAVPPHSLTVPQSERFPHRVANPVRRDLAQRLNTPSQRLHVASSAFETWEDDCLGLNAPGELCVQIPIEGWRVEVSNGHRSWFYRADMNGQNIRLESEIGTISLPPEVGDRILSVSSAQLSIPASQLSIAQSQQHWQTCPALAIGCSDLPGWRVIVVDKGAASGLSTQGTATQNTKTKGTAEGRVTQNKTTDNSAEPQNSWIYRANDSGSEIHLDEAVSENTPIIPTFLPSYGNLTQLAESIVFRTVASGGFTRQTYETILREDGKVWRSLLKPGSSISQSQSYQVSPEQVKAFQQLLEQQHFSDFNGLNYPGRDAGSVTVTLMGKDGMTQYKSVIENQLPPALLNIVQSWDRLVG